MKKFEMPVVVLNEMTMNESIASDCCYKLVTEGLVTTKTILNGGTIGTSTTYPLKPAVVTAFGARSNMPNYHYKLFIPNSAVPTTPLTSTPSIGETGVITGGGTAGSTYDVLSFTTYGTPPTISYVAYLTGSGKDSAIAYTDSAADLAGAVLTQNGGACDHFGSSCPFVYKVEMKDAHIGATMKHLFGGTNWDQPHTAQQYNS